MSSATARDAIFLFHSPKSLQQYSLLVGLTTATLFFIILHLTVFQNFQNCTARVVTRSPQISHSFQLRKSHYWLPVQSRIIFTLCTIAYQTLSSGQPPYLFPMLSLAFKPIKLRSSDFHLLSTHMVKTLTGRMFFQLLSLLFGIHTLDMLSHQVAYFLSVII